MIVRITCSDSPDLPIDQVLKRWSQTILNEFQEQSRLANLSVMDKPGKEVYSAMSSLADCVKALNKSNEALLELNQVLQQKVDSVSNKFDGLVQQHAKDKSTISSLHVDNNKLREELRRMSVTHADRTHHLLLTPQGGMRNKRQRGEYCNDMATEDSSSGEKVNEREGGTSESAEDVQNTATIRIASAAPTLLEPPGGADHATHTTPAPADRTLAPAELQQNNTPLTNTNFPRRRRSPRHPPHPSEPRPRRSPRRLVQLRACNQVTTGAGDSMKKRKFSDALVFLAQRGLLRLPKKLQQVCLPAKVFSEQHFVINCLELADYVAEQDPDVKASIQLLKATTVATNKMQLDDAANTIVTACDNQLNEFVPPKTNRKLEQTIAGMGSRIKSYKQRILSAKKDANSQPSKVGLISLEQLKILERG